MGVILLPEVELLCVVDVLSDDWLVLAATAGKARTERNADHCRELVEHGEYSCHIVACPLSVWATCLKGKFSRKVLWCCYTID